VVNYPIVVDADGLNILSKNKNLFEKLPKESILTPHIGEFKRIAGNFKNSNEKIKLQFPFVVKPNNQGSTFGLTVVNNDKELSLAIKTAFQYGEYVIAEEYIKGREVTVPILGESVYPILEIVPSHDLYDFECKYTPGMTKYFCPAKLDDSITGLIKENTQLLFNEFGCNVYARIDYLIDKNGTPYFLEINTLPGMTPTSLLPKSLASVGINFESLISKIVKLSM